MSQKLWVVTLALGKNGPRDRKFGSVRRAVIAPSAKEAAALVFAATKDSFDFQYYGAATHWRAEQIANGVLWLPQNHKLSAEELLDWPRFPTEANQ